MKYRIVTNGHVYKIQEKGFLFGWNDCTRPMARGGTCCLYFSTYNDALKKLHEIIQKSLKSNAEWRLVHEEEG